jgi:putative ABC transport system substrate-binding protein
MLSRTRSCLSLGTFLLVVALVAGSCSPESSEPSFTVGLVTNNANGLRNVEGFVEGMMALGYTEGDNVTYVSAGEPLTGDDLDSALADMVSAGVDLIFTAGTPTGVAAHRITMDTGVPVVFGVIADPIKAGVMEDLTKPGGNMTGVKLHTDQSRRLELLAEMVSSSDRIFVPFNPDDAAASSAVDQIIAVAPGLGIELVLGEARNGTEVAELLASFPEDVGGIFLVPDSTVNAHLADILALAAAARLPTSGPSIAQVEGGALTTYGFVHRDAGAQAARFADQVLRGADPGMLPVENTESFLAINLATAEEIGLEIPSEVLRQAQIILRGDDEE